MPLQFSTLLTAKIRRLGQSRKRANQLARFLIMEMMLVATAMGMVVIAELVHYRKIITYITSTIGARSNDIYYAPFGIHRQTPVL
jgi:hypothetical protein